MTRNFKNAVIAGLVSLGLMAGAGSALAAEVAVPSAAQPAAVRYVGARIGQTIGRQYLANEVAKYAGMTIEDVHAYRLQSKSLAQLLQEKGKDYKTFVAQAIQNRRTAVNALVAQGRITQDQANLSLQHFEKMIEQNLGRTAIGPSGSRGNGMGNANNGGTGRGAANRMNGQAGRGMGRGRIQSGTVQAVPR